MLLIIIITVFVKLQLINLLREKPDAISIPTRHIHQVIEMVNKEDVTDSILLLKAALKTSIPYNGANQ